jgi:RNA polymerase sigma-70 factor (ECF subfamily)
MNERDQERDDNELVRGVLNGDVESYSELVKRHQSRIFFLGLKFLKNYEEAEDFAQEVFIKGFEKLESFSGKVPFSAWLFRIGYNHGVNKYRSVSGKPVKEEFQEERDGNTESREDGPEDQVVRTEERNQVREILKKLPEIYNIVIRLRFFDGLSYTEIAEALGKPVNTVRSHLFRAKQQVRELYERYMKG